MRKYVKYTVLFKNGSKEEYKCKIDENLLPVNNMNELINSFETSNLQPLIEECLRSCDCGMHLSFEDAILGYTTIRMGDVQSFSYIYLEIEE